MAWVAVAGIAITAVGAGVSAYGAKKNAEAIGAANASNAENEDLLYERQTNNLDKMIKSKNRKLKNLGGIFDRFESTGAFGDTNTLKNLRKAQSDFSQLAAGNFTAFEDQLKQNMSDALINTVGTGSPVGSYAELAANTQLAMRGQGIQTSVGISEFLSNEANKLLGAEFGIMDQKFNTGYQMDRTRVSNVANYRLGKAATEGMGAVAMGNAGMQIGSAITSYGMGTKTMDMQQGYLDIAKTQAANQNAVANRAPVNSNYTIPTYAIPSATRLSSGGGGGWASGGTGPAFDTLGAPPPDLPSNGMEFIGGYQIPSYIPNYGEYGGGSSYAPAKPSNSAPTFNSDPSTMVLPPIGYNYPSSSILSSVGASIVRA